MAPNSRSKADPALRVPGPRKRAFGVREKTKALAGVRTEVGTDPKLKAPRSRSEHNLDAAEPGGKQVSTPHLPSLPNSALSRKVQGVGVEGGAASCQGNGRQPPAFRSHVMQAGHVACGRGGTAACVFSPPRAQVRVVVAQQDGLAGGSRCCCIIGDSAAFRGLLGVVDVRQGRERGNRSERCGGPARGFLGNVV